MNPSHHRQRGASTFVTLLVLALVGYGIYVGIQYVPIYLEARSVDAVFDAVQYSHHQTRITTPTAAQDRIASNLNVNDMDDMGDVFAVNMRSDKVVVSARYDRELNLLYKTTNIAYDRTLTLD